MLSKPLFVLLFFFSIFLSYSQDTLYLKLNTADSLLISNNLSLIINYFEIDKAEAQKINAKLFNNPELYSELSLFNPNRNQWLDIGPSGQKIVGIEKVFRIAGQRNTSIKLALEQKQMTIFQYQELLRTLKYELHTAYYRYYFLNTAISNITSQLYLLKGLIDVYEIQYQKGNISLKELARLMSVYFEINNQVNDSKVEMIELQEKLKILLAEDKMIFPTPTSYEIKLNTNNTLFTIENIKEKALYNRPEIMIAQSIQNQNKLKYQLEKRTAVPNLTGGLLYDQAGSYINNYSAMSMGIQIPLFNRNQGNIKEAAIGIKQAEVLKKSIEQEINREVESAINKIELLQEQYTILGNNFEIQLDQLSEGLVNNYLKKNISLLEFTDLFEAYNKSIIEINQLKADLNNAYEELNYVVGEEIFH